MKVKDKPFYKIGISSNPKKRLKNLSDSTYNKLELVKVYEVEQSNYIEMILHRFFKEKLIKNEWFKLRDDAFYHFYDDTVVMDYIVRYYSRTDICYWDLHDIKRGLDNVIEYISIDMITRITEGKGLL